MLENTEQIRVRNENWLHGKGFLNWYAITVRSRSERLAAIALERKGYEIFLPSIRGLRKWSDRNKEVETPLFPGYVFARFDPLERLPILTTPAVVDIVGFGQKCAPVAEEELEAVRRVLECRVKCEPHPFLRTGEKVVIESGPLAGVEGILVEITQTRRLVVSITLLRRSINVELNPGWVTSPAWSRQPA